MSEELRRRDRGPGTGDQDMGGDGPGSPVPGPAVPLLRVGDLRTYFHTSAGTARSVDGVSFDVGAGETVGIVGESGCGKSVTALSLLRLIMPPGRIEQGSRIEFEGRDLVAMKDAEIRDIRGNRIAMIFQEPMTALNPVFTVGDQIAEVVRVHRGASRKDAWAKAVEMLELMGIPAPAERAKAYPHQLSGGMRQRVMIAMALALEPEIVIMDEPTTALDVVVQRQILGQMMRLRETLGFSVIFITHDISLLVEFSDRIAIMYGGSIVEQAPAHDLYRESLHPYRDGLLHSVPALRGPRRELTGIPGSPPDLRAMPSGCAFHPRCPKAFEPCADRSPILSAPPDVDNRTVACWLHSVEKVNT